MRARRLALALLVGLAAAARAEDGLRVQREWRIVGVAVATSAEAALPARAAERALERAGRSIARELPGIHWRVAGAVRSARFDDADGRATIDGRGFARLVERLAARDDALAKADIVYVFAPLPDSSYSGMAVLRARPAGKPPVWYSVVNTRQGSRFAKAIEQRLGTSLLEDPLRRAVDSPPLRDLALHATAMHEFGHFLAPGTKDVREVGALAGWIGNGEDEPDRHDLACIMFTPRAARSIEAKVRAFPRVLQFCDRCRGRLGCAPLR